MAEKFQWGDTVTRVGSSAASNKANRRMIVGRSGRTGGEFWVYESWSVNPRNGNEEYRGAFVVPAWGLEKVPTPRERKIKAVTAWYLGQPHAVPPFPTTVSSWVEALVDSGLIAEQGEG